MWSTLVIFLIVVLATSVVAYFLYVRKKQIAAAVKIADLNVQRDTARILEEYKRDQVDQQWEEYDRQQWEKRFGEKVE